jgi:hypothetical protein
MTHDCVPQELQLKIDRLNDYDFRDKQGHPLKNCADFIGLIDLCCEPAIPKITAHKATSWFRLGLVMMIGATALQLVVAASSGFSGCLPTGDLRLLQIISNATMTLAIGAMLLPAKKA